MNPTVPFLDDEQIEIRDSFVDRIGQSIAGVFDIFTMYIGNSLGFYEALSKNGLLTSIELAASTNTQERYVREWLEQQTVSGILSVEDSNAPAQDRRFNLPAGRAEVLVERDSLSYLAPITELVAGAVRPMDRLLDAFRHGGGVPYNEYGDEFVRGMAGINRASFLFQLGSKWLPALADVHDRLQADPSARVADIGVGSGWSSIGMALAYPNIYVDGFDLNEPSIEMARANAVEAGLKSRINFHVRDAADLELPGRYDLVIAFECIHDLSDPVSILRSMRKLAGEKGAVIIADERVGDSFTTSVNDVEWMTYGWSVLHCLPVGMADQPSAGTGAVMRSSTLERYAREAGFHSLEVLPLDGDQFRFYRLHSS